MFWYVFDWDEFIVLGSDFCVFAWHSERDGDVFPCSKHAYNSLRVFVQSDDFSCEVFCAVLDGFLSDFWMAEGQEAFLPVFVHEYSFVGADVDDFDCECCAGEAGLRWWAWSEGVCGVGVFCDFWFGFFAPVRSSVLHPLDVVFDDLSVIEGELFFECLVRADPGVVCCVVACFCAFCLADGLHDVRGSDCVSSDIALWMAVYAE